MIFAFLTTGGAELLAPLAQYGPLGAFSGALLWFTLSTTYKREQESRDAARKREERLIGVLETQTPELRQIAETQKATLATLQMIIEQQRQICEDMREIRRERK
jgi:hypothetical protein